MSNLGTYRTADGQEYPIVGYMPDPKTGLPTVPLLDIPMMSDYTWQLKCLQSRLANRERYAQQEDVDAAIEELQKWLAEHTPE